MHQLNNLNLGVCVYVRVYSVCACACTVTHVCVSVLSVPRLRLVSARLARVGAISCISDGTRYSRVRPVSYITHHTRMISASAVLTCAANTETQLIALKISHAAGAA